MEPSQPLDAGGTGIIKILFRAAFGRISLSTDRRLREQKAIDIQLSYQAANPSGERVHDVSKNLRIVAVGPCRDMKRMVGLQEHLE